MGTRATVHFCDNKKQTQAIVYIHSDGYPDGLGEDIKAFLQDVEENCKDTRFDDASYLASKFVIWQTDRYATEETDPLNVIGVGICMRDPLDIEYRYKIVCFGSKTPTIEINNMQYE